MAKGEKISRSKARKWINNYKRRHEKDKNYMSSMLFHKKVVMDMLNEDKCEGLRVYNAMDEEGKIHFILVGTDKMGKNILPAGDEYTAKTVEESADGDPILVNNGEPCPPLCSGDDL